MLMWCPRWDMLMLNSTRHWGAAGEAIMLDAGLLVGRNVLTGSHHKPYHRNSSKQHCVAFCLTRRRNQWFVCKIITVWLWRPPRALGLRSPHGRTWKSPVCSNCLCVVVQSSWHWSPTAVQTDFSASGFNMYMIPLSCCSHTAPVNHSCISN